MLGRPVFRSRIAPAPVKVSLSVLFGAAALAATMVGSLTAPATAAQKIRLSTPASQPLSYRGVPANLPPGVYVFVYRNRSGMTHDLRVGTQQTELFDRGSRRLRIRLTEGVVRYRCTVPGHAAAGMRGRIRVG